MEIINDLQGQLQAAMATIDLKMAENSALIEDDTVDEAEKLRLQAEIDRLEAANQVLQTPIINIVDGSCPPNWQADKRVKDDAGNMESDEIDAMNG